MPWHRHALAALTQPYPALAVPWQPALAPPWPALAQRYPTLAVSWPPALAPPALPRCALATLGPP